MECIHVQSLNYVYKNCTWMYLCISSWWHANAWIFLWTFGSFVERGHKQLIYFLQNQNHCCAFVSKEILITCALNRYVTLISYASKIYVRLRCKIARRDIFYYFSWTVYWITDKLCPGVSVINWYQIPTYSSPTLLLTEFRPE